MIFIYGYILSSWLFLSFRLSEAKKALGPPENESPFGYVEPLQHKEVTLTPLADEIQANCYFELQHSPCTSQSLDRHGEFLLVITISSVASHFRDAREYGYTNGTTLADNHNGICSDAVERDRYNIFF